MPRLELPGGATGLLPPRYATVPGLRKGNTSRCNIKRASLMGAPSQSLRGGTRREGGGRAPPLVCPCQYVHRVYTTAIDFPCITPLLTPLK